MDKKNVRIRLFKDNSRYKGDLFVSVNGKNFLIPKGKKSKVPRYIADEIRRSERARDAFEAFVDEATAAPENAHVNERISVRW